MGNIVKSKQKFHLSNKEDKSINKENVSVESIAYNKNIKQNSVEAAKVVKRICATAETQEVDRNKIAGNNNSIKTKTDYDSCFFVGLEDVIASEGNAIALQCCAYPHIPDKISWYKDGCLIENGSSGYIFEQDQNGWNRLIIPDARYETISVCCLRLIKTMQNVPLLLNIKTRN